MRTALIVWLALAVPTLAGARAVPGAAPDLPMRRSAWLEQATDSKTCPIVRVRPAAHAPADGDAAMATVWRADDEDRSDPGTWPALFVSVRGRPLVLRRSDGDFDIEAATVGKRRGAELSWAAPAERVWAHLRLQPPRRFVEDGRGGWNAAHAAGGAEDDSTRTLWKGTLTLRVGEQSWTHAVEVESLCGP